MAEDGCDAPRPDPVPPECCLRGVVRTPRWWGGLVAPSAVAPPGPIPNPVVTHRSAGEYCGSPPREARPPRVPPTTRAGKGAFHLS
jgi:hypothetical protein